MTDGRPRQRQYRDVDITDQEWASDFIADFLKAYGFENVTFNPGASFRGLEESIVNYNDNTPRVVETPHEQLSVSIAHGYAKATGEPALCILHNVVGTLNGAMGLFNAFWDRVPIVALSGTGPMKKQERRPWIDWIHTANVQGNLVREYVKWDSQPASLLDAVDSFTRAYRIANTPPMGPVYVTIDHDLQETPIEEPIPIPDLEQYEPPSRMAPDPAAINKAADLLVEAEMPVIVADAVGDSRDAVDALVELAETLGAAVIDPFYRRYNFPNTHPLDLTGTDVYKEADVVLGLDLWSLDMVFDEVDNATHEVVDSVEDFSLIDIGTHELERSSLVTGYEATRETDVPILADTELAIPELTASISERIREDTGRRQTIEERRAYLADRHDTQRSTWRDEVEAQWDAEPISVERLAAETWEVIQDDQWVLVNGTFRDWAHRLWQIDEYDRYIGGRAGGMGVGYGIGAAIGAALAFENSGRTPINFQADGDLLGYLNALWVLGHSEPPLFTVVHNNRAFYNSTNHRMDVANHRDRDASPDRALVGTGIWEPTPDYATIAESMGVSGFGPIERPEELRPVLSEAWEVAKAGNPVLVDVVCQPR